MQNNMILTSVYQQFASLLFDPRRLVNNLRGLPYYVSNMIRYAGTNQEDGFPLRARDLLCGTADRFSSAGGTVGHYFWQDLWAARHLHQRGIRDHVDIGSRLDGFVAHILPFCRVTYVDIRPLSNSIEGLTFRQGSLLSLPFPDASIDSLSCLHVIEHVGLGRYGDPVEPQGYRRAAAELSRVLAAGGQLLIGTPVGRQRLCFDSHRIFDPQTIRAAFPTLHLAQFSLIDDVGHTVHTHASFEQARACNYGCGLFVFAQHPGQ